MSDHTPNAEAIALLEKHWELHYRGIASSDNLEIASWDTPVYESSQRLLKSLFRQSYPLIPADFAYDQCVECGELLKGSVLTDAWIRECNSDY